ncbi:MAG: NPXTG-anchored protein [Ruminiclostridium sp.]|nr:NPXTG-anchored protein [Ruminiclostridium sp.]
MKLFGKTTAFAAAAAIALCAFSFTAGAEGEYWSADKSAVFSNMDNSGSGYDIGNGIPDGIVLKTGAVDFAGDTYAAHSLSLTAEAECSECYVGDEFKVMITVENTGSSDLGNVVCYFEDNEIYSTETLAAGDKVQFNIKLMSAESDIETGGIINISATADELDEPVRTTVIVRVLPGEQNPATGSDGTALVTLAAAGLAAVLFRKK